MTVPTYHRQQVNTDGTEWWVVRGKFRSVSCSSEEACQKIVALVEWYQTDRTTEKPLNHRALDQKARYLVYQAVPLGQRKAAPRRKPT